MTRDVPGDLWKKLTSTVGLVVTHHDDTVNVMSAEWSTFVNKQPLYAAVALGPRTASRRRLEAAGEFSVTLCAEEQAGLADFAGSFSVTDIDKTGSDLVRLGTPEATATPWVTGGVLAVECRLRETVALPSHTLCIGEVVAAHLPDEAPRPLVKHGGMHTLGAPVRRTDVVAAAQLRPDGTLRVAATGPAAEARAPWQVTLLPPDGPPVRLGAHPPTPHGDLLADLPLPPAVPAHGLRVRVERGHATPGTATVSAPRPAPTTGAPR
ncbi:flavin reductase family protein [Streptomyces cellulosae]|nr:flavin reductase family protein [Streptomyces cellulosae]WTB72726.1 flavin reductase family protein [Streptomyces cellulosae]